ncbi:hypothetical protein CBL_00129 [Carabus blaptoides fortunei]
MKTAIVFVICAVGLAVAAYLPPLDPLTCQNPDDVPAPYCELIPPGCLHPKCATDGLSAPRWFKSGCHLSSYNQQCHGRYHGLDEALCSAEDKPAPSPIPCPDSLIAA